MIQVEVQTQRVLLKARPPGKKESAERIVGIIPERYRKYIGNGTWAVRNPWMFADVIPAIKFALQDSQRQIGMFDNSNEIAE